MAGEGDRLSVRAEDVRIVRQQRVEEDELRARLARHGLELGEDLPDAVSKALVPARVVEADRAADQAQDAVLQPEVREAVGRSEARDVRVAAVESDFVAVEVHVPVADRAEQARGAVVLFQLRDRANVVRLRAEDLRKAAEVIHVHGSGDVHLAVGVGATGLLRDDKAALVAALVYRATSAQLRIVLFECDTEEL